MHINFRVSATFSEHTLLGESPRLQKYIGRVKRYSRFEFDVKWMLVAIVVISLLISGGTVSKQYGGTATSLG